jgi:hypothetical protein
MWDFTQWLAAFFGGLFFVYCASRLVTAAYFRSKRDHEAMKG